MKGGTGIHPFKPWLLQELYSEQLLDPQIKVILGL
jgi:hypothetical protein